MQDRYFLLDRFYLLVHRRTKVLLETDCVRVVFCETTLESTEFPGDKSEFPSIAFNICASPSGIDGENRKRGVLVARLDYLL